jgi:hypothetical protein
VAHLRYLHKAKRSQLCVNVLKGHTHHTLPKPCIQPSWHVFPPRIKRKRMYTHLTYHAHVHVHVHVPCTCVGLRSLLELLQQQQLSRRRRRRSSRPTWGRSSPPTTASGRRSRCAALHTSLLPSTTSLLPGTTSPWLPSSFSLLATSCLLQAATRMYGDATRGSAAKDAEIASLSGKLEVCCLLPTSTLPGHLPAASRPPPS